MKVLTVSYFIHTQILLFKAIDLSLEKDCQNMQKECLFWPLVIGKLSLSLKENICNCVLFYFLRVGKIFFNGF